MGEDPLDLCQAARASDHPVRYPCIPVLRLQQCKHASNPARPACDAHGSGQALRERRRRGRRRALPFPHAGAPPEPDEEGEDQADPAADANGQGVADALDQTGRKALYFDPGKILRIEGLEAQESDALIEELTGYMIQPDGQYRHAWRKGDIVIWDNRCSYHKAAGDYPPEEDRIHWRVSIKERP